MRPSWRLQLFSILSLCGTSLFWLVDPLIIKWLIDSVIPQRNLNLLGLAVILLVGGYCGRFSLLIASLYTSALTGQRIMRRLRHTLFAKLQHGSAELFEHTPLAELVYQLEQDIDQVGALGGDTAPTLVRIVLTSALTVIMMFHLNWLLTITAILFVPVFVSVGVVFRRRLQFAASRTRDAAAKRNSLLMESLAGAIQIQLLGAIFPIKARYVKGVVKAMRVSLAERQTQLAYSAASLGTVACATVLALGLGGASVMRGQLSIGAYVAFYSYLVRLFEPLNTAIEMYSRLQKGKASMGKLMALEQLEVPKRDDEPSRCTLPESIDELVLDNVGFGYSPKRPVLRNVSFVARAGERLAVVGPSGEGKSTLLRLLSRVYEVQDGMIRINGVDTSSLSLQSLRRAMGVVPQEPILFEGTIRENMLLANRNACDEDIDTALYIAGLDRLLQSLPQGKDHRLGPFGAGLSGGEKQRLALARVILQKRPIVLLDEPTSALDAEVNARVLERLDKLAEPRILFVITHDDKTIRWASRIFKLENGKCMEVPEQTTLPSLTNESLACTVR